MLCWYTLALCKCFYMNAFVEISMFVFSLCLYYGGAWTCQVSHQFKISTTLLLIKQSHFLWWSPQSVFEYPDLCSSEILVSLLLSPKDCTLVKLEREQQQICQLENDFFFFKFIFLTCSCELGWGTWPNNHLVILCGYSFYIVLYFDGYGYLFVWAQLKEEC